MFRNVEKVRKEGERTLILSDEHGREGVFEKTFASLRFVSTGVKTKTLFSCSTNARTADGRVIETFTDIADHFESGGSDVDYYVNSVEASSSIAFSAACADTLYASSQGRSINKIDRIQCELFPDEKSRAELFLPMGGTSRETTLHVNIYFEEDKFQTMLGYIGFSSLPVNIEILINALCFWPNDAASKQVGNTNLVLECGLSAAQLENVYLERHVSSLLPPSDREQTLCRGIAVSDDIKAHTEQITRSILHMEIIVGFTALVLLACAILTWF